MSRRKDPNITGKVYGPLPVSTRYEVWKDVVGFEGLYMVSSLGRLYSLLRGFYMSPTLNSHGYLKTALAKEGKRYDVRIHQLVAAAFIGPCPEGMEVNHKHGNKKDNRWDGLEYGTHRYNVQHAWDNGLRRNRSSAWKMADDQVAEARKLWIKINKKPAVNRFGKSCMRVGKGELKSLAERFGVAPAYMYAVVTGKCRAGA